MRIATKAAATILFIASSGTAHAVQWELVEWRLGVAYASGLGDVTDLYEENLRLAGFDVDVDLRFPVGVAAGIRYDWASGIRGDIGLGPAFLIGGDVEHFEVPLSVTVGYNFMRNARISPYVRAGVTHHFVSGDQYSSSSPGALAAVGLDFSHVSIELAVDLSEVEFDTLECDSAGVNCGLTKAELNTYDVLFGVYWRFR